MRSFLALGLLITLYASASAATVHHSRHHVIVRPSQSWAYAAPRPPVHYDDTPSYNDPSKFGGSAALPATPRGFELYPLGATTKRSSVRYPP
jgi:hypothetical protein